jgi:predicted solute-binding protein
MLDNFPHIKAYWVMLTEEVASVALNFGADDMDGTVGGEKIAHDAGAISPMVLKKDQLIRIIRDAGKIPVERDVYYNPLQVHADHIIGKIPYLNSIPFYAHLEQQPFKVLPIAPRRMGMLSAQGSLDAGLFSAMDFLGQQEHLEPMGWCLGTRDQVRSVMLFSRDGWAGLEGRTIGITDDTATSVQLLKVLLAKKYRVTARLERLHAGVNDFTGFDAVLLIGDEALRHNTCGLPGFDLVYDLATEWYNWQKLPFVFAVWAMRKTLAEDLKSVLRRSVGDSLASCGGDYVGVAGKHGRRIGLTDAETQEYLAGFNFTLGEREREALRVFAGLVREVDPSAHLPGGPLSDSVAGATDLEGRS